MSPFCNRYARDASGNVRFKAAAVIAAASLAACSAPSVDAPSTAAPVPTASVSPSATAPPAPAEDQTEIDMGDTIPDESDVCPDEPSGEDDGCPER